MFTLCKEFLILIKIMNLIKTTYKLIFELKILQLVISQNKCVTERRQSQKLKINKIKQINGVILLMKKNDLYFVTVQRFKKPFTENEDESIYSTSAENRNEIKLVATK